MQRIVGAAQMSIYFCYRSGHFRSERAHSPPAGGRSLPRRVRCVFHKALDPKPERSTVTSGRTLLQADSHLPQVIGTDAPPGRHRLPTAVVQSLRLPLFLLRRSIDDLSCVLSPSQCRVCDAPLENLSLTPVCNDCICQPTSQQQMLLCPLCGEALGMESWSLSGLDRPDLGSFAPPLCAACQTQAPPFAQASAFGSYDNHLREMLHLLKYDGVTSLAAPLGRYLAQTIRSATAEIDVPVDGTILVIPVPIYQRKRAFNQSELLASNALAYLRRNGEATNLKLKTSLLHRTRDTRSQFTLTLRQRSVNLRGAFEVTRPQQVFGQQILLIDDIYTTGATARECTRTLLRAGATSVRVVTLARAQREIATLWNGPSRQPTHPAQSFGGTFATTTQ